VNKTNHFKSKEEVTLSVGEISLDDKRNEKPESYDYPFPEDVDSNFRNTCRERFASYLKIK
jgi:hypothetical protein